MKTLLIFPLLASSVIGQELNWIWQRDLPKRTEKTWVFETDWQLEDGTILLAYREATKKHYICYDVYADAFINMWDEYAKECRDTLIYDLRNGWFENEKGELLNEPKIISRKSFIGFIEYLRKKLKER